MKLRRYPFILLISLVLAGSAFSQPDAAGMLTKRFSKETGKTRVYLGAMPVEGTGGKRAMLGGGFAYAGKDLIETACCVTFDFTSSNSDGLLFKDNHSATFLVDGEAIEFNDTTWAEVPDPPMHLSPRFKSYIEHVVIKMDRNKLQQIAAAKKVKLKIGNITYTIDKFNRESFGALAKRMIAP